MRNIVFSFLFFLLLSSRLYGGHQIYFYEDESGCLHFTDSPEDNTRFQPFLFSRSAVQNLAQESISELIKTYSQTYGIEKELVEAVVRVESNFNVQAVSGAGARGLMQIMPETSQELGLDAPFDAKKNLEAGIRYLRMLLNRFGDISLALAAYNAGPGNVEKYGGIPPFAQTRSYVKKVLQYYNLAKNRS